MSSLRTGERLLKNIVDVQKKTDAAIQEYNDVLEALLQLFRDRAVRNILLDVQEIGKRSLHVDSEFSLMLAIFRCQNASYR
jgi:acetate kinase